MLEKNGQFSARSSYRKMAEMETRTQSTLYKKLQVEVTVSSVSSVDPEVAEAEAMLLGLKRAAARLGECCIVVSDIKHLVHCVPWRAALIVNKCHDLLQANENVNLECGKRLSNVSHSNTNIRYSNIRSTLLKLI